MRSVKLVKRKDRVRRRRESAQPVIGPTEWSKSVRSWVVEFQETDHSESLPAFESLFKDIEGQSDAPEK
ncbi:MAG TPA: hypothetical protein VN476_09320 [Pyrinomonadaceae bacterium]|nr:hypothetical protein [Pyrinomonadaceae bacterium]